MIDTVNPKTDHQSTLIFLHGLGDTGYINLLYSDLVGLMNCHDSFRLLKRYLSLAPHLLLGLISNHLINLMKRIFLVSKQALDSVQYDKIKIVVDLIAKEHKSGIPLQKILIGGFSQGGVIAYNVTLTSPIKFGGAIILSAWLPDHVEFSRRTERWSQNRMIKVFVGQVLHWC
ncbi:hypothetical protein MXB_2908 [Myxobolus squamalis]|nr:hypothetical protein MXB_2908 [Myxobolus squamalis]